MKKYFLLFSASFIAFEACLMAGSSSSYGMEPQIEDDGRSIVIYNPQGQKIRKIPLYQADPAADNRLFHYADGKITILLGTSTAGKTTLIDKLTCMEPYPLDYSLDRRIRVASDKITKKYAPIEFQAISAVTSQYINDVVSDDSDRLKFKPDSTLDQRDEAERALIKLRETVNGKDFPALSIPSILCKTFQEIVRHSQNRQSIIFDVVEIETIDDFLATNIVAPIEIRLLFCPLSELAKRLDIRNKKAIENGEFSDVRGGSVLWQYTQLYCAKQSSNEPTLEVLKRSQVEAAFHQHLYKKRLKRPLSLFLELLGFTLPETEEVEITSRFKHYSDIIYPYTITNLKL